MIISVLAENTSISKEYGSEHGLSLLIETERTKVLFDVGASDLFSVNAERLGLNIADVDFLVISHGHCDHGGGLEKFLKENNKAGVFVHEQAFKKHYAMRKGGRIEYIGLDEELRHNRRVVLTSDRFFISNGIEVFSSIIRSEPSSSSNNGLLMEKDEKLVKDDFIHEQNLIIEEEGKTLLVTGCAHNGIINIIKAYHDIKGAMPDYVIGGFHLSSRSGGDESFEVINEIGNYMLKTKTKYYTCHCTGIEPYNCLKAVMGESIDYLSTGSRIII